jgi:CHAT domain-containing protein
VARAALPAGSLFIAFSVGEQETLVLALDRNRVAIRKLPHGRDHWAREVEALRTLILQRRMNDVAAIQTLGAGLREALFHALGAQLDQSRRLLIAADGPLLRLPFAALWDAQSQRYLIETHSMQMVDTLNLHLDSQAAAAHAGPWLVVADADADAGGSAAALRDPERVALPEARREATAVARHAETMPAHLLLGRGATEAKVKRKAATAALLHFAVHGAVDAAQPLESALLLNAGQGEDGALKVWEVLEQMQLVADLVVLSSCNSAVGEELRGEGLLSLTRAFRYAGAREVVATLWPIADGGATRLMQRFYDAHPLKSLAAQALQRAVLAQLDSAETLAADPERGVGGLGSPAPLLGESHPYYWAGFQVY